MSGIGKFKLSDAVNRPRTKTTSGTGGAPSPTPSQTAEQAREAQEHRKARNAQANPRDRMVDIGRGNQQAGRQK